MNLLDTFTKIVNVLSSKGVPQVLDTRIAKDVIPEIGTTNEVPIIVDRQIRTKYQAGWINKIRNTNTIGEVTLHCTGGGTNATSFLHWLWEGERSKEYLRGVALFHFLLSREGQIINIIDPAYYVYHSTSGRHDLTTLGVEMLNPSKNNDSPLTPQQYTALFSLLFDHLFPTYPNITRISGHKYNIMKYSPSVVPKSCPGAGFDWIRLREELQQRGYTFKVDGQSIYEIKKA